MKSVLLFLFSLLFASSIFSQNFDEKELKIILSQTPSIVTVENQVGVEILTKKSKDISPDALHLNKLIELMLTMVQKEEGVGIAAPQIGINRNVFLIQRFDKENFPFEEFINPKIIWASELYQRGPEGCLSIPGFRADIWRHYVIQVEYFSLSGIKKTEIIEGFTAVIFQHEYDHLIGRLITDDFHTEKDKIISSTSQNLGEKK